MSETAIILIIDGSSGSRLTCALNHMFERLGSAEDEVTFEAMQRPDISSSKDILVNQNVFASIITVTTEKDVRQMVEELQNGECFIFLTGEDTKGYIDLASKLGVKTLKNPVDPMMFVMSILRMQMVKQASIS